jgi:hypothetical protein
MNQVQGLPGVQRRWPLPGTGGIPGLLAKAEAEEEKGGDKGYAKRSKHIGYLK